jgi:hypothetical protein
MRAPLDVVRGADDHDGLALLLVAALGSPIPLPVHERPTHDSCSLCGEVKPLDDFYRSARARDGRASRCKPCASNAAKAGYIERGGAAHVMARRSRRS